MNKLQPPEKNRGAWYRKRRQERENNLPEGTLDTMTLTQARKAGLTKSDEVKDVTTSDEVQPIESQDVDIQVESQDTQDESGFGSLIRRAGQNLKSTLIESDSPIKKGNKKASQSTRDDFSLLVVSVITLLVTFAKIDERVKPDTNEIQAFSNHLSGILLRHLPISNKLSADALDVIGMFAVASSWYARVSLLQPQPQEKPQAISSGANGHGQYKSPISDIAPETDSVLNRIKLQHAQGAT